MEVKITLYDIETTLASCTFSSYTARVRFILALKKLPYSIQWIKFSTIETVAKSIGAPPTGVKADGTESYTVPFVKIEYTDKDAVTLSDSNVIARYLEDHFPIMGQSLFPAQDHVVHSIFEALLNEKFWSCLRIINAPDLLKCLDPPEEVRLFIESRIAHSGEPFTLPNEETRTKAIADLKGFFVELAAHFDKAGEGNNRLSNGAFTYAEIQLAGFLKLAQQVNGTSWEIVQGAAGGRFARLLELPEYDV